MFFLIHVFLIAKMKINQKRKKKSMGIIKVLKNVCGRVFFCRMSRFWECLDYNEVAIVITSYPKTVWLFFKALKIIDAYDFMKFAFIWYMFNV